MDPRHGIYRALARIPSGLFVLTAGSGPRATGMLASWVQQIGFEPPSLCVAVRKGRDAETLIRTERAFCLAVLDETSRQLMAHFAAGFEVGEHAFHGIDLADSPVGIPYPTEAHAWMACRLLEEAADWSDHTVFCGEVIGGDARREEDPLVHVRKNGFSY